MSYVFVLDLQQISFYLLNIQSFAFARIFCPSQSVSNCGSQCVGHKMARLLLGTPTQQDWLLAQFEQFIPDLWRETMMIL
jgi:hypothetical protein